MTAGNPKPGRKKEPHEPEGSKPKEAGPSSSLQPTELRSSELILRESNPLNLESPFARLGERVTPSEHFYVRSHFAIPSLDASSYRLKIRSGRGERLFSLEELRALPRVTRTVTLECAGNGRILLAPQQPGVQWHLGAVATAEWTGVLLKTVLQAAAIDPNGADIVFEGADSGIPKASPHPPQAIPYAHSIPAQGAGEVLLAYEMNGETLAREHGFPLRAVVSGYFAMASVKWLTGIRLLEQPFTGYFQIVDYAYWDEMDGLSIRRPLTTMALKSSIARPVAGEVVRAGAGVEVFGAAWSGGAPVQSVHVSADGGQSWNEAELIDAWKAGVWRRWRWKWQVPDQPGPCTLMSRAMDCDGQVQPVAHDRRFASYQIHHIIPVPVAVVK
jgi:DMSO/TMAO reductase YedYZ molybdopterin-dependent catalytic subunit